jgi:hypothetical protein
VKGTKLWQDPGSPIIQGQSRRARPAWNDWLPAWLLSTAAVVALALLLKFGVTPLWALVLGPLGALVGAIAGVLVARSMGWRPAWIAGALLGVVLGAAAIALGATVLPG